MYIYWVEAWAMYISEQICAVTITILVEDVHMNRHFAIPIYVSLLRSCTVDTHPGQNHVRRISLISLESAALSTLGLATLRLFRVSGLSNLSDVSKRYTYMSLSQLAV